MVASRSGALPPAALRQLAAAGCAVLAVKADSSDAAALRRVVEWAREELPPIDHFAHAAGVSGETHLQDLSLQDFLAVADVKVRRAQEIG